LGADKVIGIEVRFARQWQCDIAKTASYSPPGNDIGRSRATIIAEHCGSMVDTAYAWSVKGQQGFASVYRNCFVFADYFVVVVDEQKCFSNTLQPWAIENDDLLKQGNYYFYYFKLFLKIHSKINTKKKTRSFNWRRRFYLGRCHNSRFERLFNIISNFKVSPTISIETFVRLCITCIYNSFIRRVPSKQGGPPSGKRIEIAYIFV
jgi:hypothetical protein